jgi:biopolymer transport protein ExbD
MPVKKPESRIGSSVHMKGLKVGAAGKAHRSLQVILNLTPMIDMFTILVVFLLLVFSASGEILFQQKDIQLPKAFTQRPLERVPIIGISQAVILFEGGFVEDSGKVSEKTLPDLRIAPLSKVLKGAAEAFKRDHPMPSEKERAEKWMDDAKQIIIQADEGVRFEVIRLVMMTAANEGYSAINFAVVPKGGKAG